VIGAGRSAEPTGLRRAGRRRGLQSGAVITSHLFTCFIEQLCRPDAVDADRPRRAAQIAAMVFPKGSMA